MKKSLWGRSVSIVLAALMIVAVFSITACSKNGNDSETTGAQTTVEATAEESTEPEITVAVENLSQGGKARTFNMLVRPNRYHYLFVDEASSDPVEYSVYRRNLNLEELFGIKFEITEGKGSSEQEAFNTFLAGATADFDLVCYDYWWVLDLKGYFANILDMPEIDPDDEWWYQGWNDNVTIKNQMYSIAGDANLEMLENLEVVFYNKNIARDLSLDLYADVTAGTWTIDRMMEVINLASSGLDDKDTSNDVYGVLYDTHSVGSQLFSSGLRMAEPTADGSFSLDISSSILNSDICDLLGKMMKLPGVEYSSATARARDWSLFRDGKSMMYATALYLGKSLRNGNLDFDYGILPMPKYNADAQYVSSPYGVSVFAIPNTVSSIHESALVLNAMNFYSGRGDDSLVTTFYEVVLKYQVADSVEDANILDTVKNNVYVDFAFIYNDGYLGLLSSFKDSVINGTSVSAAIKAKLTGSKKVLDRSILSVYEK